MIYALYRCLYGEDFIQQSIKSIQEYVDKIFIFWDDKPWGDVDSCIYKEQKITFPKKFDNIIDKIKELNNSKIELIYDHQYNNLNQFTHFVNDIILLKYDRPDIIFFIEVDHVWKKNQLESVLLEFKKKNIPCASSSQVELWKTPAYRIPERKGRLATIFWNMNLVNNIPPTGRHANIDHMPFLSSYVHNFGFCISEKTMYWKHMTALAFSQKIKDSRPNESWYEEKWLKWDFEKNNKNLEISQGSEHTIPYAYRYNLNELPEVIKVNTNHE